MADIRGDRSHTILVTEAVGMGIEWTEPHNLVFDQMSFRLDDPQFASISSRHRGPNAYAADASSMSLRANPRIRASMLTGVGGGVCQAITRRAGMAILRNA